VALDVRKCGLNAAAGLMSYGSTEGVWLGAG